MNLRRLNAEGVRRFGTYLESVLTVPALDPPLELLTDPATSESVFDVEVLPQTFGSRFAAAAYIHQLIEAADLLDPARDQGLWAWFSLFYFEEVCPPNATGKRKPGATARHIPEVANFQRYYRHLLAGPWRIYRAHRDDPARALVVLAQPLDQPGEIVEQLASRQELITNRAFINAATTLYVDPTTHKPKKGSSGKSKGAPRRLADFCNQVDVTWDLYSMTVSELLGLLPSEFRRFLPTN